MSKRLGGFDIWRRCLASRSGDELASTVWAILTQAGPSPARPTWLRIVGADDRLHGVGGVPAWSGLVDFAPGELEAVKRWIRRGERVRMTSHVVRGPLSCLGPIVEAPPWYGVALSFGGQANGVLVVGSTGHGTEAIDALLAEVAEPVAAALDHLQRLARAQSLQATADAERRSVLAKLGRETVEPEVIGAEGGLRGVVERVKTVQASDVPVLILGETGSGKEVVARLIHQGSPRQGGPFLRVNCGAIAPELVDSQLFGHERGAFTGATERRQGWFERADGGTLFLDEVAELSAAAQVRLLRVLQEGTLERVGGQETVKVDCRVIAATHRDLFDMVRRGTFREDLWYRLCVFPIMLPSLRERLEDLPALARHFADRASARFGLPRFDLDESAVGRLRAYSWPGNIRELSAVIDRAALLGVEGRLAIEAALGDGGPQAPAPRRGDRREPERGEVFPTLDEAMKEHIERALVRCGGRVEGRHGAAAILKINPHTLRSRMRKLGVDWKRFRGD